MTPGPEEKKRLPVPQIPEAAKELVRGLGLGDALEREQEAQRQVQEHAQRMDQERQNIMEASVELQERHVKATERIADALEWMIKERKLDMRQRGHDPSEVGKEA